ncbi:MAG: phenylalanine--tRNA ligase subunit alpha [Candidatus Nealsonbacteria bacterium DGGOD1a]|nr:MAG: phenylalanine--tRNA ligase subunit alpha [Candidatus Nealsonbacteria bacterium DGGOD1a]
MDSLDLEKIKMEAVAEIGAAQSENELVSVNKRYLDKDGTLGEFFKSLGSLSKEERGVAGVKANRIKQEILAVFEKKASELKEKNKNKRSDKDWLDVTLPGINPRVGHLHPLTLVERRIVEIFYGMGFEIIQSQEIENEWYNFDALNIPKDHPARDVFDTLFLKDGSPLRPHTSPGQVRYMENHQPPLRVIVPGRVFRRDAVDASHMPNFYQIEGLMVDKALSVANFKAVIDEFFKQFFCDSETELDVYGKNSAKATAEKDNIRLRPSFFPFTEPSFEVDLRCVHCAGKGCSACKGTGWMEVMGAGMVHPNVLKNAGVNPQFWQGFAFGIGMDRLAMIKYKVNDIRLFYENDQRFLEQF